MTEKVVLTKEQAKAIEEIKDIDYAINIHSFNKRPDSPLADIKTSELARALFVGYEVEPEFSVGDWVVTKVTNHIGKITGFSKITNYYDIEGIQTDHIRHATPSEIAAEKERRWWKKHGREPWELRYNDTLICGKSPRIVDKIADLKEKTVIFTDGDWEYFDNVKEEYKVLVFAKSRLDVKTND